MNEDEFLDLLHNKIEQKLKNKFKITKKSNLIYKILIDEDGNFIPNDPTNPKRGQFAFQTDLLITTEDKNYPLIAIEVKYGGFSTHDILTYSTKARKHKEVYPHLRYGLVIGNTNKLHNRFFTHNTGFDFAYVLNDLENNEEMEELFNIIKCQIENSRSILNKKENIKLFNSKIEIK